MQPQFGGGLPPRVIGVGLKDSFGRLRRSGYLPKGAPMATEIVNGAETHFFRSGIHVCDSRHVLKKRIPLQKFVIRPIGPNLRMRPHNLTLPPKARQIDNRNFIARQLYKNVY